MSNLATTNYLIDSPELEKYLIKQIGMLFMFTGQNGDITTIEMQMGLLKKELQTYFPYIDKADFEKALNMGVRGDFGQYFGLNVATYQSWIKAFKGTRRLKHLDETPEPKLTEQEAHTIWVSITQEKFKEFKKTGILNIYLPSRLYDEFVKKGLFPVESFEVFAPQATKKVCEQKRQQRLKQPMNTRSLTEVIKRIEAGSPDKTDIAEIQSEAKLMYIKEFYGFIDELVLK